jgi:acetyl-CoA acetyltransferase
VRTAVGRRNGTLKNFHPIDLGAAVLSELSSAPIDLSAIEDYLRPRRQVGAQSANIARTFRRPA